MIRQEALADGVLACKMLAGRYFVGFDDTSCVHQAPGLPNHLAWSLGHLALTMSRLVAMLGGNPPPESDFITGDGTRGTPERFDTESVSFGSRPESRGDRYPTLGRCIAIYDGACDRLAGAVRGADDASLDKVVRWGAGEAPVFMLVMRMIFHNGVHTGQIADLRRALGMKSIFA